MYGYRDLVTVADLGYYVDEVVEDRDDRLSIREKPNSLRLPSKSDTVVGGTPATYMVHGDSPSRGLCEESFRTS